MSFQWPEYLRLAKEFAFRETDEAAMRSAISRAYYAAFNVAKRHRASSGAISTRHGPHQSVWNVLIASGNRSWQRAGRKGSDLVVFRQRADYDDTFADLEWHSKKALGIADEILQLLST